MLFPVPPYLTFADFLSEVLHVVIYNATYPIPLLLIFAGALFQAVNYPALVFGVLYAGVGFFLLLL